MMCGVVVLCLRQLPTLSDPPCRMRAAEAEVRCERGIRHKLAREDNERRQAGSTSKGQTEHDLALDSSAQNDAIRGSRIVSAVCFWLSFNDA